MAKQDVTDLSLGEIKLNRRCQQSLKEQEPETISVSSIKFSNTKTTMSNKNINDHFN